jgi:indolepyruvate ferredoxin oxidoreductase beta subunit
MSRDGLRVLIGTVGGQGGGVLSDWLVRGLLKAGWDAQSIGLLGMSQRGGTVTYYCEAWPDRVGRRVRSMFAMPGDVNLLLGQELLELGRLMAGGYAAEDCVIVGNTTRTYATLEKMPAEEGIFDSGAIIEAAHRLAPSRHYLCNAQETVVAAGLSALSSNAFLLGLAVASPVLDLPEAPFLEAIRASEVNVKANTAAFSLGWRMQKEGRLTAPKDAPRDVPAPVISPAAESLLAPLAGRHPPSVLTWLRPAVERLVDYQDAAYAVRYLERVERLAELPGMRVETLAAFARHGGLWLAYEDIPRVAQLKTRPERYGRIRAEHGIEPDQEMMITDFLVPDTEQLLGVLPAGPARFLGSLGRRLVQDFDHRSLPLRLRSSTVTGYWSLRALSALRRWRRISVRQGEEMAAIDRWQDAIGHWQRQSPLLGQLAAEAGRVVKGYGRVRNLALADLWGFLDQGLPRVAAIEAAGGDAAAAGQAALKLLAREAGSLPACLESLDRAANAVPRPQQAA